MAAQLKSLKQAGQMLCDLSRDELQEQLILCHEMFRRCKMVLDGQEADPVELFESSELGDSDDLELYFTCKRIIDGKRS